MRIGIAASLQDVPELARVGFDELELSAREITGLTDAQFIELQEYMSALRVQCNVLNDMMPETLKLTGPNVRASDQHAYLERTLARAAVLGVKIVVFDAGVSRSVPDDYDYPAARRQVGNFLRIAQGHAATVGLSIAVMNLRTARSNLINTVSEAALLTALLNQNSIGIAADVSQMPYASEPLSSLTRCGSQLLHVHAGGALSRKLPSHGDREDYAGLFRVLARMGYDAAINAVSETGYTIDEAAQALETLKTARSQAMVGRT